MSKEFMSETRAKRQAAAAEFASQVPSDQEVKASESALVDALGDGTYDDRRFQLLHGTRVGQMLLAMLPESVRTTANLRRALTGRSVDLAPVEGEYPTADDLLASARMQAELE